MAAGPYDAPENVTLADFQDGKDFPVMETAPGVTAEWQPSESHVKAPPVSGQFTARSSRPASEATWVKLEKGFSPAANLAAHQALGLWVHGDGHSPMLARLRPQTDCWITPADVLLTLALWLRLSTPSQGLPILLLH